MKQNLKFSMRNIIDPWIIKKIITFPEGSICVLLFEYFDVFEKNSAIEQTLVKGILCISHKIVYFPINNFATSQMFSGGMKLSEYLQNYTWKTPFLVGN